MADSSPEPPAGTPKILAISDEMAWPLVTGYRRRIAQSLNALFLVGDVTWVACPRSGLPAEPNLPAGRSRVKTHVLPAPNRPTFDTARRWGTGRLPWAMAGADWRAGDTVLRSLADTEFDLLWVAGIDPWLAAERAGIRALKVVLDTDIESEKLSLRLNSAEPSGPAEHLRQLIGKIDVRRWRRLESEAGLQIAAISVCSDDEASLIGANTWTIPNSYADPGRPTSARSDSRLLFVGSLAYAPNLAGLEFFAREVFSVLRSRNAHLTLRVVGRGMPTDHWLRDHDGIEVLENVDEIGPEVASATVAVVPLLWGGGTRLKIIEAFAFATPVVSTSIGAAGLGAVDSAHLVLADTTVELIKACEKLLGDASERDRLGAAGRELFLRHFEASLVESQLVAKFTDLLA